MYSIPYWFLPHPDFSVEVRVACWVGLWVSTWALLVTILLLFLGGKGFRQLKLRTASGKHDRGWSLRALGPIYFCLFIAIIIIAIIILAVFIGKDIYMKNIYFESTKDG